MFIETKIWISDYGYDQTLHAFDDRSRPHRPAERASLDDTRRHIDALAAYVSYWHAYAVVRADGESRVTARPESATIDGLVYASSMVVLYAARHRVPGTLLGPLAARLGIAATLTANMAQGWGIRPARASGMRLIG